MPPSPIGSSTTSSRPTAEHPRTARLLETMRSERPPILFAVLAAVGVAFFVLPLVGLLSRAQWETAFADLTTPEALTALRISFVVSVASTGLALLLGVPLAWVYARVPFRGRHIVRALTTLPMILPLAVYIALETRPEVAIMLSLVLLAVSLAILVAMRDRYLRAF